MAEASESFRVVPAPAVAKKCYFFHRPVGCRNGTACQFIHDPRLLTPEGQHQERMDRLKAKKAARQRKLAEMAESDRLAMELKKKHQHLAKLARRKEQQEKVEAALHALESVIKESGIQSDSEDSVDDFKPARRRPQPPKPQHRKKWAYQQVVELPELQADVEPSLMPFTQEELALCGYHIDGCWYPPTVSPPMLVEDLDWQVRWKDALSAVAVSC